MIRHAVIRFADLYLTYKMEKSYERLNFLKQLDRFEQQL